MIRNLKFFRNIDTEESAYWLGFIFADGNIRESPSYVLAINLKRTDRDHLEKFVSAIGGKTNIYDTTVGSYCVSRLAIGSAELCEDLISHGVFPRKSSLQSVPRVHPDLARHFWRGVFDGDGSLGWTKRNNCDYATISLNGTRGTIEQFVSFLKINHITKGTVQPHFSIAKFTTSGTLAPCEIARLLYADSVIYLSRKHILYQDFVLSGGRREKQQAPLP